MVGLARKFSMTVPSRRQFLQATAATAFSAALADAGQPRQPAEDPFGGFTVGIQSYSYRKFTFERALEQIRDLGLRHAEFYREHIPLTATDAQMKAVKNLLEKYRITPIA